MFAGFRIGETDRPVDLVVDGDFAADVGAEPERPVGLVGDLRRRHGVLNAQVAVELDGPPTVRLVKRALFAALYPRVVADRVLDVLGAVLDTCQKADSDTETGPTGNERGFDSGVERLAPVGEGLVHLLTVGRRGVSFSHGGAG